MRTITAVLTVLALVLFAGCAKPPEMEMKSAQAALDAAKAAEADIYDMDGCFNMAQDTLNAAMAAVKDQDKKSALSRNYDRAKALFVSAKKLADDATTHAAAGKEKMRREVEAMLPTAKEQIEAAKTAVGKVKVTNANKADVELMKTTLAACEADITDAGNMLNSGKIREAKMKVDGAMAQVQGISTKLNPPKAAATPTPQTAPKPAPKVAPKAAPKKK